MKGHQPVLGELMLGHLRYGTHGRNNVDFCQPIIKRHAELGKNLAMAGNFNLVNIDELYEKAGIEPGSFQKQSDLAAMMETVHRYLCQAADIGNEIHLLQTALSQASAHFDGGFTYGGLVGNGNSFVVRDAHGIRPVLACFA